MTHRSISKTRRRRSLLTTPLKRFSVPLTVLLCSATTFDVQGAWVAPPPTFAALIATNDRPLEATGRGRAPIRSVFVRVVRAAQVPVVGALQETGTVTGVVTDSETGTGIGGVDVSLEDTQWGVMTDADGRYRLADVAPGRYTVVAARIGYRPERRTVTVAAGLALTLDLVLQPTATPLGEVVVTARKREERLQDVPMSIAVVSIEEIDRRRLISAEDYLRGVPGASQVESTGRGGQATVIRGVETNLSYQNFSAGSTTASYFGETPTTYSASLAGSNVDIKLVDIERVEVLRGPQGTAFGNSSMGGAVRTIPVAPKLDRFEGRAAVSYSATSGTGGDNHDVQLVGNAPLIKDKLAFRVVGYRFQASGFYQNRAGSDPGFQEAVVVPFGVQAQATDQEEVGATRFTGGRMAAAFQPSNDLQFTLSFLSQENETDGFPLETSGTYEQTALRLAPEHVRRGQSTAFADANIDIGHAAVEYDLGWADLVAAYSYVRGRTAHANSQTLFNEARPASFGVTSRYRGHIGEVRFATKLDGAWNFLAGVYADFNDDEYYWDNLWNGDPETNDVAKGERFLGDFLDERDLEQKAAFGEVSWAFLPGLSLTGGVRAYQYDRTVRTAFSGPIWGGNGFTRDQGKASGANFRANLSYKLGGTALLYAGWSEGFRVGKPQPGVAAAICDTDDDGLIDDTNITVQSTRMVHSDNVDSYELGGKFELLAGRLILASDVFLMDWVGLPVVVSHVDKNPDCWYTYLANAGRARSEGLELQGSFFVTNSFRVDLGASWIHARLTEDAPAQGFSAGDRLPGSPKVNANLGVQHGFEIVGHEVSVRADVIYVGSFYGDVVQTPATLSGGYAKVDASARMALKHLDLDLFVRNLTNADDYTSRGAASDSYGQRLRPRTIGVQLSRNF